METQKQSSSAPTLPMPSADGHMAIQVSHLGKKRKRNEDVFSFLKKIKQGQANHPTTWPVSLNEPLRSVPQLISEKGYLTKETLNSIAQLRTSSDESKTILLHLMPTLSSTNYAGAKSLLLFKFFQKVVHILNEKPLSKQLDSALANRYMLLNQSLDLSRWFDINPNQVFSLPLSWARSTQSGHAIMCNVKKDPASGLFLLQIFNAGSGSGRLKLNKNNHEVLVASSVIVKDIKQEKIESPAFVNALYTLVTTVMPHADNFVYDYLVRFLDGKVETNQSELSFTDSQIIGNCSWMSLWLWAQDFLKNENHDQAFIDRFHLHVRTFGLLSHYANVIHLPTLNQAANTGFEGYHSDSDFEYSENNDFEKSLKTGSKIDTEKDLTILLHSVRELAKFAKRCGVYEQALIVTLIKSIESMVNEYLDNHLVDVQQLQGKKKKGKATKLIYEKPPVLTNNATQSQRSETVFQFPSLATEQVFAHIDHENSLKIAHQAESYCDKMIALIAKNTKKEMSQEMAHQLIWLYVGLTQKIAYLQQNLAHSRFPELRALSQLINIPSKALFKQIGLGRPIHDVEVRKALASSQRLRPGLFPITSNLSSRRSVNKVVDWYNQFLNKDNKLDAKHAARLLAGSHHRTDKRYFAVASLYSLLRNLSVFIEHPQLSIQGDSIRFSYFFTAKELGNNQYAIGWASLKNKPWQVEGEQKSFTKGCFRLGDYIDQHGNLPSFLQKNYDSEIITTLAKLRCKHPVIPSYKESNFSRLLSPIDTVALMQEHPGILSAHPDVLDYLSRVILEENIIENLPHQTQKALLENLYRLQSTLLSEGAFRAASSCAYFCLFMSNLLDNADNDIKNQSLENALLSAMGDSSVKDQFWFCATLTDPQFWRDELLGEVLQCAVSLTTDSSDQVPDFMALAADKRWKDMVDQINNRIALSPKVLDELPWRKIETFEIDWDFFDLSMPSSLWQLEKGCWKKEDVNGQLSFDIANRLMAEDEGVHSAVPAAVKRNLPQDLKKCDAIALKTDEGKVYSFTDDFGRHTIVDNKGGVWRSLVDNASIYFQKIENPRKCVDVPEDIFIKNDLYGYMQVVLSPESGRDSPQLPDLMEVDDQEKQSKAKARANNRKSRHFVFLNKETGQIDYVLFSLCQLRRLEKSTPTLPGLNQKLFDKAHPNRIRIQEQVLDKKASDLIKHIGGNEYIAEGGRGKVPQIFWPSLNLAISLEKNEDNTITKRVSSPLAFAGWEVIGKANPQVVDGFPLGIEITKDNRQSVIFSSKLPKAEDFDGLKRQPELFIGSGVHENLTLVICNRCPRTQELLPFRSLDAVFLSLIHTAYMHYDRARLTLDHLDVYGNAFPDQVKQGLQVISKLEDVSAGAQALKLKAQLLLFTNEKFFSSPDKSAIEQLKQSYYEYLCAGCLSEYPLSPWEQRLVDRLKLNIVPGRASSKIQMNQWDTTLSKIISKASETDTAVKIPVNLTPSTLPDVVIKLASKIANGWRGKTGYPGTSFSLNHLSLIASMALCGAGPVEEKVAGALLLGVIERAKKHDSSKMSHSESASTEPLKEKKGVAVNAQWSTVEKFVGCDAGKGIMTWLNTVVNQQGVEPQTYFEPNQSDALVHINRFDKKIQPIQSKGAEVSPPIVDLPLLSTVNQPFEQLERFIQSVCKIPELKPILFDEIKALGAACASQMPKVLSASLTPQPLTPVNRFENSLFSSSVFEQNNGSNTDITSEALRQLQKPPEDHLNSEEMMRLYLNGTPEHISVYVDSAKHDFMRKISREKIDQLLRHRMEDQQYNYDAYPEEVADIIRSVEYFKNCKLRAEQKNIIANLCSLNSGEHTLTQLRTGFGKTAFILPMLLRYYARTAPERLTMYMAPQAQLDESLSTLKNNLSECFGMSLDLIPCSRQRLENLSQCLDLRDLIRSNISLGRPIALSKESFQTIFLSYFSTLDLEQLTEYQKRRFEALQEVVSSILKGVLLIDEAQEVLGRLDVNHAQGEAKPIDQQHIQAINEVVQTILSEPSLTQLLYGCTKETYMKRLGELRELVAQRLLTENQEAFLKGTRADEIVFTDQSSHDKYALLWGVVNDILASALQPELGLHFGFGDRSTVAVPFEMAGKPSPRSEFGDALLSMALTLRAIYQEGLSLDIFKLALNKHRENILRGISTDNSRGQVEKFFTQMGIELKQSFLELKEKEVLEFLETLNLSENRKKLTANIGHLLFPVVTLYEDSFNANANDIIYRADLTISVTGTPWNHHSLPPQVDKKLDRSVDAHVLNELLSRPVPVVVGEITPSDYDVFIDAGAHKRSLKDDQLCQWWTDDSPGTYIFTGAGLKCLNQDNVLEEVSWLAQDGIKRRVVYPQPYTLGADFNHSDDAKALVTIGRTTTFSQLVQAIGRMRNFFNQVDLTLHPDADAISDMAQLFDKTDAHFQPTVLELTTFTQINQARLQYREIVLNELRCIKSQARANALKETLSLSSIEAAQSSFKKHRHAFSDALFNDPIRRFSKSQSLQEQIEQLRAHLNVPQTKPLHPFLSEQDQLQTQETIQEVQQQQAQRFNWHELQKKGKVGSDFKEWPYTHYMVCPHHAVVYQPSSVENVAQATATGRPPVYAIDQLTDSDSILATLYNKNILFSHGFALLGQDQVPALPSFQEFISQENHFSPGYYWLVSPQNKDAEAEAEADAEQKPVRMVMITNREAHWSLLSYTKNLESFGFSASALDEETVPDNLDVTLFGPDAKYNKLTQETYARLADWEQQCVVKGRMSDASRLAYLRSQKPDEIETIDPPSGYVNASLCHLSIDKPLWSTG